MTTDEVRAATAIAFAANEAIASGMLDEHLHQLHYQIMLRLRLYEPKRVPPKTPEMIESGHQVWAWISYGDQRGRWEVRGTGVVLE